MRKTLYHLFWCLLFCLAWYSRSPEKSLWKHITMMWITGITESPARQKIRLWKYQRMSSCMERKTGKMNEECLICKAPLEYLDTDALMECAICHKMKPAKEISYYFISPHWRNFSNIKFLNLSSVKHPSRRSNFHSIIKHINMNFRSNNLIITMGNKKSKWKRKYRKKR